jgi:hypothetical protein
MAATRRDVFKTSVLSAFGLMAGGSSARAAEFGTTKAVVRARFKNHDVDLLLDASSGKMYAYYTKLTPTEGDLLDGVEPNGLADPGTYVIATTPQTSLPSFTVNTDHTVSFSQPFANAWNEIGARQSQLKSYHRSPRHR